MDRHISLLEFVNETCKGRDDSHGLMHMLTVTFRALGIYQNDYVLVAAMLHDVADHKYDRDGELGKKVALFLEKNYSHLDWRMILRIIEAISFSKEDKILKEGREPEWYRESEEFLAIRNAVSDADKVEAIGVKGVERCREFTREHNPGISEEELRQKIQEHAQEKLLRLYPDFFHTPRGLEIAKAAHEEMVEYLKGI